ncbi:hypothetical protein UH38_19580 [Aliterella atlantica CENA595]|uniref:Uncharacterized protein n=2 Tax=Aliterella TaxID=1827277 RepID=A0A0D8ZPE0_9CYAN|nr:hypothetical protein UH38_19580 [Aliterella atlantica CENA595]
MTTAQVEFATRELKIELFKTATWGGKLASYLLTHKSKLDQGSHAFRFLASLLVATLLEAASFVRNNVLELGKTEAKN